jgi:uncharacterized protein (TIGR03067 family)
MLLLFTAPVGPAGDRDQDLLKLKGTWIVLTNASGNGKTDEPYNRRDRYRLIIKGKRMTWQSKSIGTNEVAFRIDPKRKPKELDLDLRQGKPQNECIYELHGDKLRLCIGHFGRARPKEFTPSETASLVTLRRATDKD